MIAFVISVLGVVIALASMNISQRLERIAKAIEAKLKENT